MAYTKTATSVEKQISLLKERGMCINDEEKAKEILADVGYYRLGSYWYCYEKPTESPLRRNHLLKENTSFDHVVRLYYFDCDLRKIILPYLNRIEINFRTRLTYHASNKYLDSITWFADERYVQPEFMGSFKSHYRELKKNIALNRHHKKYPESDYAPAWKTIEYMMFGDVLRLYVALKDPALKEEIARLYNVHNVKVFENYMNTIRILRNLCAHGRSVFDLKLQKSLASGPIPLLTERRKHNITGCLLVLCYLLRSISKNREADLKHELLCLCQSPEAALIRDVTADLTPEVL